MVNVTNILIDKQDSFEIVRDQIAQIIADESVNQQALATSLSKDPDDWKLRVFTENLNAFQQFAGNPPIEDVSPIVNVWFESMSPDEKASDTIERQTYEGRFNIDCYGYGVSEDDGGTGHIAGDVKSALESQRATRLVRNILMLDVNYNLQLSPLVTHKMPQDIEIFQPTFDPQKGAQVLGARLSLRVRYDETAPQFDYPALEELGVTITRASDGRVYAKQEIV